LFGGRAKDKLLFLTEFMPARKPQTPDAIKPRRNEVKNERQQR
jgi:hypothetical protein